MLEIISNWFIAFPVGVILGWFTKRLFGPTADALGAGLLDNLSRLWNKEGEAIKAYQKLEDLLRENHKINKHGRFKERKTYLHDREITLTLLKYGRFVRRAIKEVWINNAEINSFDQSDVFFAGMNLFFAQLTKDDVSVIFKKFKNNNQAILEWWLGEVQERNPKLLSDDVLEYLRIEQAKWIK